MRARGEWRVNRELSSAARRIATVCNERLGNVAQHDAAKARDLFVVFTLLLLILLVFDIIFRVQNPVWESAFVAASDLVAAATAAWAVWD